MNQRENTNYQPPRRLQAFGESGGQVGVGIALVFEAVMVVWVDAEEIWVEAAAPVRARTTTKARTMFFMTRYPKSCIPDLPISLDRFDRWSIGLIST